MYLGIQQPKIISSSLRLSRGFYAIFSVPFPISDHFHVMGAIDAATVKRSKVQLRSRQFRMVIPPAAIAPSTSAPSSSMSGVTLEDIMAHLVCMDARLDILKD